ncbi:MAG: SUF system NifU family Fe-S cluster assembly protein [Actinomycetota bacterium]|nr:SUF system NifU family Fe-S cluster assembly protein [Actinomycetota bacterium]
MAGLEDLYREIILDHYKNPRHKGDLEPPAHSCKGFNPLCGDEVVISVQVDDGVLSDIRFSGQGCSISQSSASMMSAAVQGRSLDEVADLTRSFKSMMSIEAEDGEQDAEVNIRELGDLAALQGVQKFPTRIKCATLAWNTLSQALDELANGATADD